MTIGEKIKIARKQKKISQQELGNTLGVSQAMIAQYEKGDRNPKLETIVKIASALDVSMFDLISLDEYDNLIELQVEKQIQNNIKSGKAHITTAQENQSSRKNTEFPCSIVLDITKENYEKYPKYFNAAFSLIKEVICSRTNTKMFSVETGKELNQKDMEEIFDSLSIDEKLTICQELVENITINTIFGTIENPISNDVVDIHFNNNALKNPPEPPQE